MLAAHNNAAARPALTDSRPVFGASRTLACLAGVASIACLTSVASAQRFYTTEVNSGELRIVNYANGAVTTVGSLGVATTNMDLAWHQGVLYGLDNGAPGLGNSGNLYSIATTGPTAGQATLLGNLSFQGVAFTGEALGSDGTFLYAGWGAIGTNISNRWGVVGLTGAVTYIGEIDPNEPLSELDGAGFGNGRMWGIDLFVHNNNQNNYFYNDASNSTPGTFQHSHGAYGFTVNDSNDLVASIGTSLFTITSSGYLIEYAQTGGAMQGFTQLALPGNYRGLEIVPAPGALPLLLGAGLVGARRRR